MIRRSMIAFGVLLSTGMAAPTPPPAPPTPAAPAPATAGQDPKKITLITGDVVTYRTAPDGTPDAQVEPARRPGGAPVFFFSYREKNAYYVYPTDVLARISSGGLDRGLFDVAYLAANGYTDAETQTLPVIVQNGAKSAALPATSGTRALPSIGATALRVDKRDSGRFWSALSRSAPGKIWLDRKVRPVLDSSVKQIGAPEAWAAGVKGKGVRVAVLDTGIDPDHPDVVGRVAAMENFTADPGPRDGHGHGTHVAATIAGSGEKYTGVAPEAELVVGKVLNDYGGGQESEVIAGMEWAVAQRARIVNMSLGGCCPGPGNPLDQAVAKLSEQGTLFVVAAGNDGTSRSIGSPGTAPEALTVGAVDDQDRAADFSSRGPTAFDYTLKPDLTAPGVGIVSARAQGTSMGAPVGERHTAASGTSMATPHVAGAAALLAQRHPDWSNARLKAALTSTSRDTGRPAYTQGAGRVDVARAVRQQVHATGNVDFGFLAHPQPGPATRTLTYANDGDQPVTLSLRAEITPHLGTAPDGTLTLDRDTLTVPANGSAAVAVAFAPKGPATWYEGRIEATADGGVSVGTAVGAFVEPKKVTVRTRMVLPDGATEPTAIPWMLMRTDERDDLVYSYYPEPGAGSSIEVYPGTYAVVSALAWRDGRDGEWAQSLPTEPQVEITEDTTVTLDLRKAEKVEVDTPRASEVYSSHYAFERRAANGVASVGVEALMPAYGLNDYRMPPTRKVTQGTFVSAGRFLMGVPLVAMRVKGGPELTPRYAEAGTHVRKLPDRGRYPLLDAGRRTDFAGLDARGKLVLLDLSELCPGSACDGDALDRVTAAQAAGAAGVLGYGAAHRAFLDPAYGWPTYPIPTLSLPAGQGRALSALVARRPVTVAAEGSASTPYFYSLTLPERGRIPADLDYDLKARDLRRVENRFHADRPGTAQVSADVSMRAGTGWFTGLWALGHAWRSQTSVTEYVGPLARDVVWTRNTTIGYDEGTDYYQRRALNATAMDVFDTAGGHVEPWGAQPRVPGNVGYTPAAATSGGAQCFPCRTEDLFVAALPVMGPFPNHQEAFAYNANFAADRHGGSDELHLYRDGREIPLAERSAVLGIFAVTVPTFTMDGAEATYRMTDRFRTPNPLQRYGREVETAWTFRSKPPTGGLTGVGDGMCVAWFVVSKIGPCEPVRRLNLRYDLGLGLDNRAQAGAVHRIRVTGYHGSLGLPDAKVTDLRLRATFDDGRTWTPLHVTGDLASVAHPPLGQTAGAVGLKAEAKDTEGNTIEQTIYRAYGLK
jgi:subtilisin family serine protease